MKLILVSSEGEVVDSTDDFTREEWDGFTQSSIASHAILNELSPGGAQ